MTMEERLAPSPPPSTLDEKVTPVKTSGHERSVISTMAPDDKDGSNSDEASDNNNNNNNNNPQQPEQDNPGGAPPAIATKAQQPLSPPALAACATTASSGSSASSNRRIEGLRRNSARFPPSSSRSSSGSHSHPAAAAAAALPPHMNLYDSLVRYQEDNDDSTTVSMTGETLRSVSTWYSVQSDDDRKIPARPTEGTYEGTYREPIRRPYRPANKDNNSNNNNNSNATPAGTCTTGPTAAMSSCSSSDGNSSGGNATASQSNFASAASGEALPDDSPQSTATPGTEATAAAANPEDESVEPPPVVYEEEKDDQTAVSSLVNSAADPTPSVEEYNTLARYPLSVLDEGCAVGNYASNTNTEFACLSAAAQLAQEASMGNMVETTRSAPTPYDGAPSPAPLGVQTLPGGEFSADPDAWGNGIVDWGKQQNLDEGPKATDSDSSQPEPAVAEETPEPPPMNDFTRMQQTLGMQDLCVPGSTSSSGNNRGMSCGSGSSSRNTSRQSSGRGRRSERSSPVPSQGRRSRNSHSPSPPSSHAAPPSFVDPSVPINTPGPSADCLPPSGGNGNNDPTAEEQYQIWKKIQEEQERKQMELALQLSEKEATTHVRVDNSDGGAGGGTFDYPSQNAKASQHSGGTGASGIDEDEALQVALRMSQEEEAARAAAVNTGEEEDEIALALRLSKEQAEADQKRWQQLQETAGELSEEEQLRLAMEQSMEQSMGQADRRQASGGPEAAVEQHHDTRGSTAGRNGDDDDEDEEMRRALAESLQQPEYDDDNRVNDDNDTVDDEIQLALRLSQAQLEEEERFRQNYMQSQQVEGERPHRVEEPDGGSDRYSEFAQHPAPRQDPLPSRRGERRASIGLDDSELGPPVRTPPTQEPASPGLSQPRKAGSPVRRLGRMMRGRRGNSEAKMDIPGAIPPFHPSPEDLESMSSHAREAFEQKQNNTRGKVHGPDDGNDMPPVSRPQRRDQGKTNTRSCTQETHVNAVDIDRDSRDVLVREGQSETRAAIMQGQSQIVTCRGCFGKLHAPVNCSLVFCPTCNTVSQVNSLGI